jgi:hypothetical protein
MAPRATSAGQEQQSPAQVADLVERFLALHPEGAVLEDGKVLFDLRAAKHSLSTEYGRCTLHLWSEERNLVRQIVSAVQRGETCRLDSLRFGHSQSKLLELVPSRSQRTPTSRESARSRYLPILQRGLQRQFPDARPMGFRSAMDLEKSFGPAYARGSLVRGREAWAVIGVNQQESLPTIDAILTLGVLWLHDCRERAGGVHLYRGLKVVLPRGTGTLTLSRMAWLRPEAGPWELWEFDQASEEMTQRDIGDHGNLRTRLVHHPDPQAAAERFAAGIRLAMELVPPAEQPRVEQRLRSASELAFLLHGLEFARVCLRPLPHSFAQATEVLVGVGTQQTVLNEGNRAELSQRVAELFARRRAVPANSPLARSHALPATSARRIGRASSAQAHSKVTARLTQRPAPRANPLVDPLYRAAPERWLESMLRQDISPLTRSLGPAVSEATAGAADAFANDPDPDSIGNRAQPLDRGAEPASVAQPAAGLESRLIPRLDPGHVYAQVPAIAGASDRGLLDLLGVTSDGRLAVIELKVEEDLHFAMQGLDYWMRVRHHHLQAADAGTGLGELQRHGYFRGLQLSPLPPRLYLIAPALHIHPATEIILRYLSPRVEWSLLALDERWRHQVRVVWRRQGGSPA